MAKTYTKTQVEATEAILLISKAERILANHRLEDALHVLSDEQCERAGGTRSGSVMDVLSELVATEFLALMEVSDRRRDCR